MQSIFKLVLPEGACDADVRVTVIWITIHVSKYTKLNLQNTDLFTNLLHRESKWKSYVYTKYATRYQHYASMEHIILFSS